MLFSKTVQTVKTQVWDGPLSVASGERIQLVFDVIIGCASYLLQQERVCKRREQAEWVCNWEASLHKKLL